MVPILIISAIILSSLLPIVFAEPTIIVREGKDPLEGKELVYEYKYYSWGKEIKKGETKEEFEGYSALVHFRIDKITEKEANVVMWASDIKVSASSPEKEQELRSSLEEAKEEVKETFSFQTGILGGLMYVADAFTPSAVKGLGEDIGLEIPAEMGLSIYQGIPTLKTVMKSEGETTIGDAYQRASVVYTAYNDLLTFAPIYIELKVSIHLEDKKEDSIGDYKYETSYKLVKGLEHIAYNLVTKYIFVKLSDGSTCYVAFTSRNADVSDVKIEGDTLSFNVMGNGLGSFLVVAPKGTKGSLPTTIDDKNVYWILFHETSDAWYFASTGVYIGKYNVPMPFGQDIAEAKVLSSLDELYSMLKGEVVTTKKKTETKATEIPTKTTAKEEEKEKTTIGIPSEEKETTGKTTPLEDKLKKILSILDMKTIILMIGVVIVIVAVIAIKRR